MTTQIELVYQRLLNGDPRIYPNEVQDMVNLVNYTLQNGIQTNRVQDLLSILKISNLLYNNNANGYLVLDDDLYDRLVVMMKNAGIQTPIGAPNVIFNNFQQSTGFAEEEPKQELKEVVTFVKNKDSMNYFDIFANNPTPLESDFTIHTDTQMIEKGARNRSHEHDLCGTLDKCKYTLDNEARADGRYDDNSVMIFERDFLAKHIQQGFVNPNDIHLIVSLKYDGISVENTIVNDTIVSSCSRGDMLNNEARDLTPLFGGMQFERASKRFKTDKSGIGVKFEYIITDYNKQRLERATGIQYANKRNAVIGLIGRLDARRFRDYLTPVPLESTLGLFHSDFAETFGMGGFGRIDEINFLNQFFNKGIDLKWTYIHGDYTSVLFQLNNFVREAEYMRDFMPFAYDGVVVEYAQTSIRKNLGKLNSIPRYAIAIKFNPAVRYSTFTGYSFSVGQSGVIVPMAHFEPVEFFGATHNKTTVHSLKRFNNLRLKRGEKVKLTLNNDVIVYLHKLPAEMQDPGVLLGQYEEFPTVCPSCGQPLYESDSGDTAYCTNFICPDRCIARVSNFLAKMNIRDFSDATVRALHLSSPGELFHLDPDKVKDIIGEVLRDKLFQRIEELKSNPYPDYRIIGSVGFSNIAIATWETILQHYEVKRLIELHDPDEINCLSGIKGIGPKTVQTILHELRFFMWDLQELFSRMNVVYTPLLGNQQEKPRQVVFTGFRDPSVEQQLEKLGFEIKPNVTNDTMFLVVPYIGFKSTKVDRVFKILSNKMSKLTGKPVLVDYTHIPKDVFPTIVDQAIVEDTILKLTNSETKI